MDKRRPDVEAELAQTHDQGWVKVPRVFSLDDVRELKALAAFHHAETTKKIDPSAIPFLNRGHDDAYHLQPLTGERVRAHRHHDRL